MKNTKAIILQGLARGGSNLVWNILQSHPSIVSTMLEINEIIGERSNTQMLDRINFYLNKLTKTSQISRYYFKNKFTKYVLKNLHDPDNKKRQSTLNTPKTKF